MFSEAWARACQDLINANTAYREAARTWEGSILLLMSDGRTSEGDRRVYLDLWHGECREARIANAEDQAAARYVLHGTDAAWRQVLTGELAPLMAVVTGKLRLAKGALMELLPYAGAAKELIAAASRVPTAFPIDP